MKELRRNGVSAASFRVTMLTSLDDFVLLLDFQELVRCSGNVALLLQARDKQFHASSALEGRRLAGL
jgi:hypothetical protein